MKKSHYKSKILICCLSLILVLTSFLLIPKSSVNAAGTGLTQADMDINLFYKLQSIAGGVLNDDSIYKKNITELDLSFSALGAVSTSKKISSLEGLELLDLRTVTVLKVNHQNISELKESTLSGMPNLERLEIVSNNLTQLTISQNAKLKVLLADNNNLSKADLSVMDASGYESENSVISLNYNKFSSINQITFPMVNANSKLTVNLINNNITDINLNNYSFNLNLGIQGARSFNDKAFLTTTQSIYYYNLPTDEISAKIFKIEGNNQSVVYTLKNSEIITPKYLEVGEYKIKFYLNDVEFSEQNKQDYPYYVDYDFTVKPPAPTYYFLINGEKIDHVNKLTKKATLVINSIENAKTYYSVNGADWVEGNEVKLTKGGTYPVALKYVIGDYESEIYTVTVNASINLAINEGVLILIIALVAAVFLGVFIVVKKYVLDK